MPDASEQESLHAEFLKSVENGTIDSKITSLVRRAMQIADRDQASKVATKVSQFFGRSSSKKSLESKTSSEQSSFSPLYSVGKMNPSVIAHVRARESHAAKMRTGLESSEMHSNPMHGKGGSQAQTQKRGASSSGQRRG